MDATKLRRRGYTVELALEASADEGSELAADVYIVEGHGIRTYVLADDDETWALLEHDVAHAHRKWLADNPEADDLERAERAVTAAEAMGDVSAADAEKERARIADERAKRPPRPK